MIDDARCIALQRLVLGILRIEETQGVALEARPAFLAEPGQMRPVVVAQQLAVRRSADLIANAVEVDRDAPISSPANQFHPSTMASTSRRGLASPMVSIPN